MLTEMELPLVAQRLDFTCGAACFDSMFKYFHGWSPGEMYFAEKLGALKIGYTPPESIVRLAEFEGLHAELKRGATLSDLEAALVEGHVVFVTWWDEDAGHYSLVKALQPDSVLLMDPWKAREGSNNRLNLDFFVENWKARGSVMIRVSPLTSEVTAGCAETIAGS